MKKTIKTSTNEFKKIYFQYILDSINFEDVDPKNDKEKMELFWVEFDRVANNPFNKRKLPNLQSRIADYLTGLPFDFLFENYKILELAKSHGTLAMDASSEEEDEILANYWNFTAMKIIQLSQSLEINTALWA